MNALCYWIKASFCVTLLFLLRPRSSTALMRLSNQALGKLQPPVQTVGYDRSKVTPGILHVGVGNFHRAHMADYLNDLFKQGNGNGADLDFGIVGAGVTRGHPETQQTLKEQDYLWTVIERDANQVTPKIIGSMVDCVPYQPDNGPLQEALLDPNIKIVSMTVTEGGYFLSDGKFNPNDPLILSDAANPDQPKTLFGLLVQALKKRRDAGTPPFTVMSCDNVPHNGDVSKSVTVGLARLQADESDLADWIDKEVAFPNSMVDRITPATTVEQKASGTQDAYGYIDNAPVYCEPWRQWIFEDNFCNGRPAFDKLDNVEFVKDVSPFELMKIRILNGGHATLSYPAALLGIEYVHEAVEHDVIGPFLDKIERTEIVPSVPPVPDTDLMEYWDKTRTRFVNPTIEDSIARNCYDGASRQPKFIVPTALDGVEAGRSVQGLATVSALWCRYCFGNTQDDPIWDVLHPRAQAAKDDPKVWLVPDIYGTLGEDGKFVEAFGSALQTIHEKGVEAAMKEYIES